ncbi:MAG: VWA domain-containing protein [Lachnospiraceae bacterium]|nr:VWA domain-containing protein [Lachnospiraceae bacterium]
MNPINKMSKILHASLSLLLIMLLLFNVYSPKVYAAEDGAEEEEELLAPYFIIQNEDVPVDLFPLKSTEVTANINGIIAEVYVVQTYANEGEEPINARYVFPTSSGVTMHGMRMEIGDNVVTAQIREKEEAKEVYEEAKNEGKSASLLEQKRPNVFTMDVANIMPGDAARIELHYTELISPTEGIYEFVFPTVVGPRYAEVPQAPALEELSSPRAESRTLRAPGSGKTADSSGSPADNDTDNSGSSAGKDADSAGSSTAESDGDWLSSPYLAEGELPPGEYHITVNLSTGVPIADVSCKSHQIRIDRDGNSQARITLADPEDYAGNRDFILKYRLTGEEISSGLVLTGTGKEKYFMLTVQPPERFTPEEIPPREYLFVLDVSGSMHGFPLDTAKTLIRDLAANLRETDTFNLVLFADDTVRLSPESLQATKKNIKYAMDLIDKEEGGGGTSMLPALEEALSIPFDPESARSVVVITDGYISNENEIFDLINKNMDTASFFSFGIGSSVNDYLIKGIAGAGLGESFVVTDSEDAAECAERFCSYIASPLLTGFTVSYEGFRVYDMATSTPSILYAQKPIVLFGKWSGEPAGTITLTGKMGEQDYVQEISVSDAVVDTENEAIRYLWARTRLDQIAGYGSLRNDDSAKEEITRLGLDYNMATPYTSFVAVIDVVRNTDKEGRNVRQASPLPLGVSNLAIGGDYRAYSEPEGAFVLLAAACVLPIYLLRYMRKKRQ